MNTAACGISAAVLAFGFAAPAQAAVELKCKPAAEVLADMNAEGQSPALTYYIDGRERGSKVAEYNKVIISVNPNSMTGYEVTKADANLCVTAKLDKMAFYRNDQKAVDGSVFIQTDIAKKLGGINGVIYADAKERATFPMLKAHRVIPALKADHILFVSANPATGAGVTIVANNDGSFNNAFTKAIEQSNPALGISAGAQFTPVGAKLAVIPR